MMAVAETWRDWLAFGVLATAVSVAVVLAARRVFSEVYDP
jgi:hypothetical protein